MSLPYVQKLNHAGVEPGALDRLAESLTGLRESLATQPPPQAAAIFSLLPREDDLEAIYALAARWRKDYRHLVVVGAGGSGLSGKAIALLKTALHGFNIGHALHVLDNADPYAFSRVMGSLPLSRVCFLAVSKSGSTVETYAQTALIIQMLLHAGIHDLATRFAVITLDAPSPLRALAETHGIPLFAHAADLGGRFSIFSEVGLIPAAFVGLDIAAVRRGGALALRENLGAGSPAAQGAALQVSHMRAGRPVSVTLTYNERLWGLNMWWRQCWAESLGKQGVGSTPVIALGPLDQHSQLQLWLDGPEDKIYTLLHTRREGEGGRLGPAPEPLSYLNGHTLGDIIDAQQLATAETLTRHRRPLRIIEISEVNEYTLGALLAHFTLEIIFTAALLSINPFNQPAIEESKRLAHEYLARSCKEN